MYKKISVEPQYTGYLYIDNKFSKELQPGVYYIFEPFRTVTAYFVPNFEQNGLITNQEILTKDNISLRISQYYTYEISDGHKYIERSLDQSLKEPSLAYMMSNGEDRTSKLIQERIRELVAGIPSEELNSKRLEIEKEMVTEELIEEAEEFGVAVKKVSLIDVTFPKSIQEIFASELAAKVRARTDLENARTAVASTRAYKNAADLMKGDQGMQFLQLLETMQKIAQKGNHTFVIGENLGKSVK